MFLSEGFFRVLHDELPVGRVGVGSKGPPFVVSCRIRTYVA